MSHELQNHQTLAQQVLDQARLAGASQAEVTIGADLGFAVTVRQGEVETLEHQHGKTLTVTVYFGHQIGSVSTSDLSASALKTALEKACSIARFTGEDPCSGLPNPEDLAYTYPDLELSHPWTITPEQAIELARECEQIACEADARITNSEGASLSTHHYSHLLANSHGFMGIVPSTYHSISCGLVAQQGGQMHADSDYTVARDPLDLSSTTQVAKNAARRTVQRLDARSLSTRKTPVIFSAEVARTLIGHFLSAISGSKLYRQASFLLDHLQKPIFPAYIHIQECPHRLKGIGSAPFDGEGVKTRQRDLVTAGVLQTYLLGSYSARKLGMQTTGNVNGAHNVVISPTEHDLAGLLREMGTGLLVTDLMGQGINLVTGDYSRGAFGYWVERGEIQYPVQEITIAGSLPEMFKGIVAVGQDVDRRGNVQTGSIWLDQMMVAG